MSEAHSEVEIANDTESLKISMNNPLKMSVTTTQYLEESQGVQTRASCKKCKKEFSNKYVMKKHMIRTHGIVIKNLAKIRGFDCDICKKKLSTKNSLHSHKQNSHGIVDFGGNQSRSGANQGHKNIDSSSISESKTHDTEIKCVQEQEPTEGPSHYETRMEPEHSRSSMQCIMCGFASNNLLVYSKHVKREHSFIQSGHDLLSNIQIEEEGPSHYETRMEPEHSRSSMLCTMCGFDSNNFQAYSEHVKREHSLIQSGLDLLSNVQIKEKGIGQDDFTMQPFMLEQCKINSNSSIDLNSDKTFLSSIVYLPVREILQDSVAASFKLTPVRM